MSKGRETRPKTVNTTASKTSSTLQTFSNSEFGDVRVIMQDGEPWFVGKDVAKILGYTKARNAMAQHVDEDDALKQGVTDSLGRIQ